YEDRELRREDLAAGTTATERLGIAAWSRSYNWRAQGFFNHFTTYAEALQLIASLLFRLIIASISKRRDEMSDDVPTKRVLRILTSSTVLMIMLAAMGIALLLTSTRASQFAFMVSAFSIIVASGSRKLLIAAGVIAIPIVLGGLLFLQETRNIG